MAAVTRRTAYLSLGGNIGDPAASMGEALRILDADRRARVRAVSSLFRTPPWGKTDQPDFLNAAACIETDHDPRAFLELCLAAERALKRERKEHWGPRIIDIDILVFGDVRLREPGLEIPHPRMLDRAFVLVPLAEIAPTLDLDGRTAGERARASDRSGIVRVAGGRRWWRRVT